MKPSENNNSGEKTKSETWFHKWKKISGASVYFTQFYTYLFSKMQNSNSKMEKNLDPT